MKRLQVNSQAGCYDVIVGRGAWQSMRECPPYSSAFVLTERRIWNRWGKAFLAASGLREAQVLFVPAGEASKSLNRVERVASQLLRQGADRRSLLVAFGGGVIGDLGGFVASTYMRGIACVQVPTTVVAQVDSAIGGKTAVNVGSMKNLVGTFYPPRLVLAEPAVLSSLDERAFRSGLYEVAKHAILDRHGLFEFLESKVASIGPGKGKAIEQILVRAAAVKVEVVSRDEHEAGLRRVLNLGHTFGHALEEATAYRRFLHGEAVGWGLLIATRLAELQQVLKPSESERIADLLCRIGPLPSIGDLPAGRVIGLLSKDKKAVAGRIHWILPERIGKVRIVNDVPLRAAREAFNEVQRGPA
jgi:3-dehydroquinate synthase